MQLIFAGLNFHDPYDELRQRQTCSIFVQEIGKICSTLDQLEADLSTTQAIGWYLFQDFPWRRHTCMASEWCIVLVLFNVIPDGFFSFFFFGGGGGRRGGL